MRTEPEIREAYGYLRDAYDSAKADGNETEAKMYCWMINELVWFLGAGEDFAAVIEAGRKAHDDAVLSIEKIGDGNE